VTSIGEIWYVIRLELLPRVLSMDHLGLSYRMISPLSLSYSVHYIISPSPQPISDLVI